MQFRSDQWLSAHERESNSCQNFNQHFPLFIQTWLLQYYQVCYHIREKIETLYVFYYLLDGLETQKTTKLLINVFFGPLEKKVRLSGTLYFVADLMPVFHAMATKKVANRRSPLNLILKTPANQFIKIKIRINKMV